MASVSTPQPPSVTIRVSAPGKVILHGEHSVVYEKLAFAASLGLRTRLEYCEVGVEPDKKHVMAVDFPALNLLHIYDLQDVQDLLDKPLPLSKNPANYNFSHPELVDHDGILQNIKAFIREKSGFKTLEPKQQQALTAFLYLLWSILGTVETELKPFKLKLNSDLTIGAGTGSSASFAVTVVAFLLQYIRLKKCKSKSSYKTFKAFNNSNLAKFDKQESDLISRWAFQSEKIIHGTPSGVDNTICTFGGLVEFRKGAAPKLVDLSTKFSLILINTKVPRDTRYLVEIVAAKREKYKMIIEGVLETMDEVTIKALDFMKKINRRMGDEFDVLKLYESLGEMVDINQNLLRCLGVSHPKLDEICLLLAEKGLHGKLTGAGGGGYAICLVPPYFERDVVRKVIDDLNSRGFNAVLTDLGGCGVTVDSL